MQESPGHPQQSPQLMAALNQQQGAPSPGGYMNQQGPPRVMQQQMGGPGPMRMGPGPGPRLSNPALTPYQRPMQQNPHHGQPMHMGQQMRPMQQPMMQGPRMQGQFIQRPVGSMMGPMVTQQRQMGPPIQRAQGPPAPRPQPTIPPAQQQQQQPQSQAHVLEPRPQLIEKAKLDEIAKQIDSRIILEDNVQDLIIEHADNFVEELIDKVCVLAQHRGKVGVGQGETNHRLEVRDAEFVLSNMYKLPCVPRNPQVGNQPKPEERQPAYAHLQRTKMLARSAAKAKQQ